MNENEIKEIPIYSITIFSIGAGKDGQATLLFKDVSEYSINDTYIKFKYISQTTKLIKSAIFKRNNIAGHSTEV